MDAMPGRCFQCGVALPKTEMIAHVRSCCAEDVAETPLFLLFIEDAYFPETYWLLLEIAQNARLHVLDDFLRRAWVDCCGHYSQFLIDGEVYGRRPNPSPVDLVLDEFARAHTMDARLCDLLSPGAAMTYAYDEIWPTELHVQVLAAERGPVPEDKVRVRARNFKPKRPCRLCGQPAVWLYTDTWPLESYCDAHARAHAAWGKSDAFLPDVNSPRVGICTYRGPAEERLRFEVHPPE